MKGCQQNLLGLHVVGITGREKAAGEQQHGKQQCQKHDDVKPQAVNDIATRSVLRSPHGNNSSVTTTINFNYASILAHLRSLYHSFCPTPRKIRGKKQK